jgi:hypothetical protein
LQVQPLATGLLASNVNCPLIRGGKVPFPGVAPSFGGHTQRYPFSNSVDYEQAIVHYPGWGASQNAVDTALKTHGLSSRLMVCDPGHGWAIGQFTRQPEAKANNRFLLEADTLYRERVKRYLSQCQLTATPTILTSLDDPHPKMDLVSGLNVLTQRNPLQRQELLNTLSTKVLAPKGELILTETILDFPLLGWGARGRALFKHSANVVVASVQQGQWGNLWLEANHFFGALKAKEWFPLRDTDLRRIVAQQGLAVTATQQVFPTAKAWVPFRNAKQGVFVYHIAHQPPPSA